MKTAGRAAKPGSWHSVEPLPYDLQNLPQGTNPRVALAADPIAFEDPSPEINGGRFAAKCVVGEPVLIEADIFSHGHDTLDARLLYRPAGTDAWLQQPMSLLQKDRWRATVVLDENRLYQFTFCAWHDLYATWREDVAKKDAAAQGLEAEVEEGRGLLQKAARSASANPRDANELEQVLASLMILRTGVQRLALLKSEAVAALMSRAGPRTDICRYSKILEIFADRKAAAFSAWYELFPRSQSGDPTRHGTFDDVVARLPYVRSLGFDVLYFPPIHPIGRTMRKGRNNNLTADVDDVGSPYAIGSEHGGHDAIHPELGSFEEFRRLMAAAREHGLEIALDFAIQCSPDHPWIRQHPEWFAWRPDGSLKFAENPPKKYEDIVNLDFRAGSIPELWHALRHILLFWINHGVKIFRVDNPHTKPFPFWEWMIGEVRAKHPDVIFLAEGFTRPNVMKHLAKLGFSQSYSHFTWRNTKRELEDYLTELTKTECRHYIRPNFFANTPDINPIYLQQGGRPGFQVRLILAGTLGGNYGIYNGFEIGEAEAIPGKEEYLNSEKYEIRAWDMDQPGNVQWDIRFLNRLRREHKALQDFTRLAFYNAWNDNIIYYGKRTADLADFLLFHVCLDPHSAHGADFEVPLWEFGLPDDASIEVEDMVTGHRFTWHGKVQHIHLDPFYKPYAAWRLIRPAASASS
ncbi:alpha-1,4-glucan--maltose-1-phosphate maltosyltransferase [Mesorhizobium sp. ORM16]|uniref:alpha-1,4-glucan--maltose-1-phosphate maltosyltransferase n=1 Tax=Mesorhizobium sp. ORM16 TaxID=3376989 RepID=UPI003857E08C